MALMHCRRCGTDFAVGMPYCPQCTATDAHEVGADGMPKITKHGGPSYPVGVLPEGPEPEAVDHPADGTMSPPIEGDGSGEALPDAPIDDGLPDEDANKAEWVEVATRLGFTKSAADHMHKADLIDKVRAVWAGDLVVDEDGQLVDPERPADDTDG